MFFRVLSRGRLYSPLTYDPLPEQLLWIHGFSYYLYAKDFHICVHPGLCLGTQRGLFNCLQCVFNLDTLKLPPPLHTYNSQELSFSSSKPAPFQYDSTPYLEGHMRGMGLS